jgi:heme exporter protein C
VSTEAYERSTADRGHLLKALSVATILGILVGLYMALVHASTDALQGPVQRIFYLHISSYGGAAVAFTTAAFGGAAYLRTRKIKWDILALSGVEVGFALSIVTLVSGMIWAHPIWNTWWTWDPRLTSAAIMTLTYAAYLMLRNGIENPDQRRRFAAIYGILALSTVIFTFIITRIRPDTIHPTVFGPSAENAKGGFEVGEGMGPAIGVNMMVFTMLLSPTLVWCRVRLENLKEDINRIKIELMNQ